MKEHPLAAALCLGAAAYGVYKIFFADKKTNEGKEQSSLLDKIGLGGLEKKTLGLVLGALALGGLIGFDKIEDAIKKYPVFPLIASRKPGAFSRKGILWTRSRPW